MKLKKILSYGVAAVLFTGFTMTALAQKVNFDNFDNVVYFYCTASDSSSTVDIDTHRVDFYGFCKGQPYVSSDGHIKNMPSSIVNQFSFIGKKNPSTTSAYVDINLSGGGSITCTEGTAGRSTYGSGGFCATPPPAQTKPKKTA